jgi:xanthine dehydrogenase YagS FAD-binding subunit
MQAFEYASPANVEQALRLLGNSWEDAAPLAGGTDLLCLMKDDIVAPRRLVNIKDIGALRGLSIDAKQGLRIGALVTIQELADNAKVAHAYPVIAKTANEIAGPQIRNMATIGGNLCQRPRCWYYRGGYGLLARDHQGRRWFREVTIAITRSSAMTDPRTVSPSPWRRFSLPCARSFIWLGPTASVKSAGEVLSDTQV